MRLGSITRRLKPLYSDNDPLWALPIEVKIEEVTLSLLRKRPGNPECPRKGIVRVKRLEPPSDAP